MSLISNRLNNFDSSDFRDVFLRQQSIIDPIDLSIGLPEDLTPTPIKEAGINAIMQDKTIYTPSNGIPELRDALSNKFKTKNNINVSPEQVAVVPGLTTGLLLVYLAILDPGDEVIVMEPAYPPYTSLVTAIGGRVVTIPTFPSFQPDIPLIEASITSKTKAIVVNSPNNPTGAVYSKETLIKLAKIADEHNILIISDEIYEHFVYEGEHFSIGSIYPNTITMNGFSKEYAMTGWRLGYVAGPLKIIEAINELQQYMVMSSSSIAQYAALEAIKQPGGQMRNKYLKKRNYLLKRLTEMGYSVEGAQGAFYMFIQAPADMVDLDFVEKAADHDVLIVPGRAFASRHGYFRISYGSSMETLEKGLDQIEIITRELNSRKTTL